MCSGLSGESSTFLRSLTMKLSTVRFDGAASIPQIFYKISSRETGWPTRSCSRRKSSTS